MKKAIYLFSIVGFLFASSCTKDDDDTTPTGIQQVEITNFPEDQDSTIAEVRMRIDEVIIADLPTLNFYDSDWNEYDIRVNFRNIDNEIIGGEFMTFTSLPYSEKIFVQSSDQLIRVIVEDQDGDLYDVFEVNPKDYENQTDFEVTVGDSNVDIKLKGIILK